MTSSIKRVSIGAGILAVLGGAYMLLQPSSKVYYASVVNGSFVVDGKNTKDSTGKTVSLNGGDTIRIKSGKYTGGSITNISTSVFIDATNVEVVGTLKAGQYWTPLYIANSTGFTLSGLYLHDNNYMGISINGSLMDDVTFQNMKIDNINNTVFKFESNFNTLYDGTDGTVCNNIRFINIEAARCSLLFSMTGRVTPAGVVGLCRGIEVAYCYIHDAPDIGNVMWAGAAEDYNIHDNRIDKINQNSNNHNGIFMMTGNGTFVRNRVTNHQGNAIRAWVFSVGTTPKTMEIRENFVYNSRQYSPFELQVPDDAKLIVPGKTTYCNAIVRNNTAGQIAGSTAYDNVMLDLYDLKGGSTEYYNNLGFAMLASKPITDMINMGNDKITRKENNVYKATWQEAITDLTTFKSKFTGVGASVGDMPIPDPKRIDTALQQPGKKDTIYKHDTLYLPGKRDTIYTLGKAAGKYILTIDNNTVTLKKQ